MTNKWLKAPSLETIIILSSVINYVLVLFSPICILTNITILLCSDSTQTYQVLLGDQQPPATASYQMRS